MPIYFHAACKPLLQSPRTSPARYDASGEGVLAAKGRHDPNVAPHAVPIVEAMAALTIADALMAQHARQTGVKIAAPERQCISKYEGSIHCEGTWRLRGKPAV
uniref:chorismate synthase n=1 Tax=Bionectria ochroleuca TaxID=29856 RepID=A0A8H7NJP9_BIOOC